jgi:glycosyltransferase involved in cell wall biosynthesis
VPLVSVVIPTYDRAFFVCRAIDSVLGQRFTDYEIVVVDDGSTDDTRTALKAYANKIKYIYQENSGVSSARNTGIEHATGEWVAFLDSDDEWTEDCLSAQIERIEMLPQAVGHIANAVTILADGQRSSLFDETGLSDRFKGQSCLIFERPLSTIIEYAPWFLQASILRRDVLLRVGLFDTNLSIAEDLDVISRVAHEGPFTISRNELVEIIRREETIENLGAQSLKRGIYRYKAFGKVFDNLLNFSDLTRLEKTTIERAQCSNLRSLGNVLIMAGKKLEARNSYRSALFLCPAVRSLVKFAGTFLPGNLSGAFVRKNRNILPGEYEE